MGEVYRARDTRLNRDVAIKVLPAGTATDPRSRERLRLEAMAAAALDHPFICKIFEAGEHEGTVFLVMEYIAGATLHSRLQRGPLPPAEALRVAGEIADAIEAAHEKGIIHRDLKPANVMLTPQGHVKIMDFGLARRLVAPADADAATIESGPQLTAPGSIIGTPDYMSPEQAKGLPLDRRSDLFSFGVILAEMIGGRHPFRRASTAETISAVLREPPDLGRDLSPGVRHLLDRLLAKERRGPLRVDRRRARRPLAARRIAPDRHESTAARLARRLKTAAARRPGCPPHGSGRVRGGALRRPEARPWRAGGDNERPGSSDRLRCCRSTTTRAIPARTTSPKA